MPHIHDLIDLTVSAFIVNKNKVLLVNHKILSMWLPVGGHVELHEDTDDALIREIKEECGLDVKLYGKRHDKMSETSKPLTVPQFIEIHKFNERHRHLNLSYFAYSESDKVKLADKEHNEIKWFTAKEIIDKELKTTPDVRFFALQALKILGKK
ncbi:MAG: NUDIX domain-containing protein [Candidatus Aenigmarchaeota archaeon]|nr:NUDIX domain-containing protein [Candidatus Aenigmarchaeota archaeon]